MNRRKEFAIAAAIGVLLVGLHYFREVGYFGIAPEEDVRGNEKLIALLDVSEALTIGERTRRDHCTAQGPLPDPACTPGAIFPGATPEIICIPGYTKTVRNVSAKTKSLIYREYGLSYPQPKGAYEVDHLIPLELGGSNDQANLFSEAAFPLPGFHEKDLVENYLHNEVCAGRADLSAAQKQIAHDWVAVYNILTPEELAALRDGPA